MREHVGVVVVAACAVAWIVTVVLSGVGVNIFGVKWNFATTALLGDSFGVLSSGMAALAAYFAFVTYKSAKDEAEVLARRAAEPSFLNLLERRFTMMENVIRGPSGPPALGSLINVVRGQIAIDWAAGELWHALSAVHGRDRRSTIYNDYVEESIGGLTSYHRYVYHVIAYAERQFAEVSTSEPMTKDDPSYGYVRLLRAQLSDSEMQLMAFNAIYGAGNPKLRRLIERYALFNNMPEVDIVEFRLPDELDHSAFGLLLDDQPKVVREWSAT